MFSYNGTTYAPLRALAEAYGLDVGYDAQSNLAMVGKPGTVPGTESSTLTYEEFAKLWKAVVAPPDDNGTVYCNVYYQGTLRHNEFKIWWNKNLDLLKEYAVRYEQTIPRGGQNGASFYYDISLLVCTIGNGDIKTVGDFGRGYEWLKLNEPNKGTRPIGRVQPVEKASQSSGECPKLF